MYHILFQNKKAFRYEFQLTNGRYPSVEIFRNRDNCYNYLIEVI